MNTSDLITGRLLPIFLLFACMLASTNDAIGQHNLIIQGSDGTKALAQFTTDQDGEQEPVQLMVQELPKPVQYALEVQDSAVEQLNAFHKEEDIDTSLISNYWIGVRCEKAKTTSYSPAEAPEMELPVEGGIKVLAVSENSASEEAGLQEGDVLLRFSDQKLNSLNDLYAVIGKTKDTKSELVLIRKGKLITSEITPQKRPEEKSETKSLNKVSLWTIEEAYKNEILGQQVPEGHRIQVELVRGKKIKFKVIHDDDTWQADSDSIKTLPDSVQPLVVKIVSQCKPMVEENLTVGWNHAAFSQPYMLASQLPLIQSRLAMNDALKSSLRSSLSSLEQKIIDLTKTVKELESKMDK